MPFDGAQGTLSEIEEWGPASPDKGVTTVTIDKKTADTVTTELDIAAPVEAVWEALTDARELERWFPLEARVTPGAGGSIRWSWGEPIVSEARIDAWEPGRYLRAVETLPMGAAAGGDAFAGPATGTGRVMEFTLESRGGTTRLRMVHSGFTRDSDWDEELFDGVRRGWAFELRGLRHYLQRHRGADRTVAWARAPFSCSFAEAWSRVMSPRGLLAEGRLDGLTEGDRYAIRAASGDALAGVVSRIEAGRHFSGTVASMNDALVRVEVERHGPPPAPPEVSIFLSAYDVPDAEVKAFEMRMAALLRETLA